MARKLIAKGTTQREQLKGVHTMDATLALERYKAHRASYKAYGWAGALTLRQYMKTGRHLISPWLGRYDGCTRN